ncbi:FecR family protein [uncultured Spirosoma sp.]|nr:FecR family protein [uncultured Spirosoma sp.]MBN8827023.1 FecR family protein [Spirosoma sp.]
MYNKFTLQDFLNDDAFIRWALHNQQDAYWQQVLVDYPHKQEVIRQALQLIQELHRAEDKQTLLVNEERTWQRISEKTINQDPLGRWPKRRYWTTATVVSLVVVLVAGWLWVERSKSTSTYSKLVIKASEKSILIEKVNQNDTPLKISLEDGSVVYLKKNSRFSYPAHFTTKSRETFLSGEAFFQIAPNPKKPFYVYANELVTQVLGTSFDIKAFDNEQQVLVKVRTGRVSVYNQNQIRLVSDESQHLILLPNQQVVFNRQTESLSKQLVEEPIPIHPFIGNEKRYFEDVPVATVLQALEKRYDVRILYNEELLANCIITTTLSDQSLIDQLEVICQTIGATYKEMDAQLVIESSGCP